jgi:hypothetical protein
MKMFRLMVVGFALAALCGCATSRAVSAAKGEPYYNKDGQYIERTAQPAYYLLVPLTIPLDVAFGPIEILQAFEDPEKW